MQCEICCQGFTTVKRKVITCPHDLGDGTPCNAVCCSECARNYIRSKPSSHCFKCKTIWSDSFLYQHFPKTWVNGELITLQSLIVLDQQKAILPQTMIEISREEMQENMHEMEEQLESLDYTIQYSIRNKSPDFMIQEYLQASERTALKLIELSEKYNLPITAKNCLPCFTKGCRGFIFEQSNFTCKLCQSKFCLECYDVINQEDHVCNDQTKRTIQLIKSDTKPCPKCKEMIYKVSGCDQMFCTICTCLFSWSTGRIDTGIGHNPHYREWKQQQDSEAKGSTTESTTYFEILDQARKLQTMLISSSTPSSSTDECQEKILQNFIPCLVYLIKKSHQLKTELDTKFDPITCYRDQRVLYLKGQISDDGFLQAIIHKERDRRARYQSYEHEWQFIQKLKSCLYDWYNNQTSTLEIYEKAKEWIRDYNQEQFNITKKTNGKKMHEIKIMSDLKVVWHMSSLTKDDIRQLNIELAFITQVEEWMYDYEAFIVQFYLDDKTKIERMKESKDCFKAKKVQEWCESNIEKSRQLDTFNLCKDSRKRDNVWSYFRKMLVNIRADFLSWLLKPENLAQCDTETFQFLNVQVQYNSVTVIVSDINIALVNFGYALTFEREESLFLPAQTALLIHQIMSLEIKESIMIEYFHMAVRILDYKISINTPNLNTTTKPLFVEFVKFYFTWIRENPSQKSSYYKTRIKNTLERIKRLWKRVGASYGEWKTIVVNNKADPNSSPLQKSKRKKKEETPMDAIQLPESNLVVPNPKKRIVLNVMSEYSDDEAVTYSPDDDSESMNSEHEINEVEMHEE
jgi:hypothetical protein